MARQRTISDQTLRMNWQREIDSLYLYRRLSQLARRPDIRKALAQMAEQEAQHAEIWGAQVRELHVDRHKPSPDLRVHLIVWLAWLFGAEAVLGLLIDDEVSDIATYAEQAQQVGYQSPYQQVLATETAHAQALAYLRKPHAGEHTEPWHKGAGAGNWLRDVVYGFNDGLTANFGLVMGVVGATVDNRLILLAGFAGLLADALSMAASGFLASRSQQEVQQHQLMLEQAELHLMPKEERQELAGFYEKMGLTRQEALTVADRLMKNSDVALTQLAREELGIDPEAISNPLQEGIRTGIATGLGAVIPILPFLILSGATAVWVGIVIAMAAHFLVGASRAIFTGRPALRSGFEMFLVGMGVALVTFLLGRLLRVQL
jgi:vacuolar iron transporter family protein